MARGLDLPDIDGDLGSHSRHNNTTPQLSLVVSVDFGSDGGFESRKPFSSPKEAQF